MRDKGLSLDGIDLSPFLKNSNHMCNLPTGWIFTLDGGDNMVNDSSIYYVEGTNMLSPSLQPPTTGNVLIICVFFIPVRNCILLPEIILLSSKKQNIQVINNI
jgi:hypothetical protein